MYYDQTVLTKDVVSEYLLLQMSKTPQLRDEVITEQFVLGEDV